VIALRIVAVIAFVLGILAARVLWSSRVALNEAQSLSGEARRLRLGEAARLYAPGNPWSRRALESLAAEARENGPDALANWREVRSAILGTRSFYTPHRALLDEANEQIAILTARADNKPDALAFHRARLAEDYAPSAAWSLAALVGLLVWLSAAVVFAVRGLDERDRLRARPALACAVAVAAGLALFFVGLSHA
jgi:hypothetical protein